MKVRLPFATEPWIEWPSKGNSRPLWLDENGPPEEESPGSSRPQPWETHTELGRARRYAAGMCRNIRVLHNFDPPATPEEVEAAAVQYVRKISGATRPSKANEAAFGLAVEEITAVSKRLLDALVTTAPPRDREVEAAKAKARVAARFA